MIKRKYKKKIIEKSKKNKKKIFFYLTLFIFLIVSFWILIFSELTRINDLEIESDCWSLNQEQAKNLAFQYLDSKYFNIFLKKNIILFNQKDFESFFKKNNKLIKDLEIERVFPKKIKIKIICEKDYFVWHNSERFFLINKEGKFFSEISEEEKDRYRGNGLLVRTEASRLFSLGDGIFTLDEAVFICEITKKLEELFNASFKKEMRLPILVAKELIIESERGWKIIFSIDQSMEKQLKIIDALLKNDFKDKNLDDLEYIDLRIAGKAIYKFKKVEIKDELIREEESEKNAEENGLDKEIEDDKKNQK